MNKIENYLGIANHDIQMANDSEELKSYVASILCEIDELQQKNQQLQERIEYLERSNNRREDTIFEQRQEISDLEDNWNKLKEYCKENTLCYEVGDDENTKLIGSKIHGLNVLDKMQELEQGSDSNE